MGLFDAIADRPYPLPASRRRWWCMQSLCGRITNTSARACSARAATPACQEGVVGCGSACPARVNRMRVLLGSQAASFGIAGDCTVELQLLPCIYVAIYSDSASYFASRYEVLDGGFLHTSREIFLLLNLDANSRHQ